MIQKTFSILTSSIFGLFFALSIAKQGGFGNYEKLI